MLKWNLTIQILTSQPIRKITRTVKNTNNFTVVHDILVHIGLYLKLRSLLNITVISLEITIIKIEHKNHKESTIKSLSKP